MKVNGEKKKRSFFTKLLLFINAFFILFLIFSYLAPYISPAKAWFFSFMGLFYPLFLFVNLGFVIYWSLRKRWLFIYSLITIIIGWNNIGKLYQLNGKEKITKEKKYIEILSYNVKNFDIYNYDEKWKTNKINRNKIFAFIQKQNAEIICFQEFVYDKSGKFKTLDTLVKIQKANNYYFEYSGNSRNTNFFGKAIYSAYPIINKGKIDFSNSKHNGCIYIDIKVHDDTARIYNAHFQSIHLTEKDKDFAKNLSKIEMLDDNKTFREDSKRIFARLKNAYIKRAKQAAIVKKHTEKCPYPFVICGDFNDTPYSYTYRIISQGITDCFVESGNGFGKTYRYIFPHFRIDYIFHSQEFESANFTTYPVDFSDHHPIKSFIKWKE